MTINHPVEAEFWWQVTSALPTTPTDQRYFALRRLWADHTMNSDAKGRGFYRWGTEDNITPGLFQIWAIFEDPEAIRPLLSLLGVRTNGTIRSVRWAYACEEAIVQGEFPGIGGRFLIPDIVLHLEDAEGPVLIAFEVKKPGKLPDDKDVSKLKAYTGLRSMDRIHRKEGVFLIGDSEVSRTQDLASGFPTLSWEDMRSLQLDATRSYVGGSYSAVVAAWIDRAYSRYGIGDAPTPEPFGVDYGQSGSYRCIEHLGAPEPIVQFLKGSEAVESFFRGQPPEPPCDWLQGTLSRKDFSRLRIQATPERRINRWSPTWNPQMERDWETAGR